MWERTLRGLAPYAGEILCVVRSEQGPVFRQALSDINLLTANIRIVHDDGAGPAAAVVRAAKKAGNECLLVVGVDHPHFDDELIRTLLESWNPSVDAVAVEKDQAGSDADRAGEPRGLQPLWALYRRTSVNTLALKQDWSNVALRDLLGSLSPVLLRIRSRAFNSVNEPADLHAFDCTLPTSSP